MKWIEIIALRSLKMADRQFVVNLLDQISREKGRGHPVAVKVYRRSIVETDLSIHFHWEGEQRPPGESALGLRLTSALKGLGLINHSIWVEVEPGERPVTLSDGGGSGLKPGVPARADRPEGLSRR